jgi:hypothetical protein
VPGYETDQSFFANLQPVTARQHPLHRLHAVGGAQHGVFPGGIEQEDAHVIETEFAADDGGDLGQQAVEIQRGTDGARHLGDGLELFCAPFVPRVRFDQLAVRSSMFFRALRKFPQSGRHGIEGLRERADLVPCGDSACAARSPSRIWLAVWVRRRIGAAINCPRPRLTRTAPASSIDQNERGIPDAIGPAC